MLPEGPYDFAFSTIVFQHIPSREVIYNYVREVHRLLRPGALFKFQVQGDATMETAPDDTWLGVPFSDADAVEMAEKCGFEPRHRHGAGEQYFWLWFSTVNAVILLLSTRRPVVPHSFGNQLSLAIRHVLATARRQRRRLLAVQQRLQVSNNLVQPLTFLIELFKSAQIIHNRPVRYKLTAGRYV